MVTAFIPVRGGSKSIPLKNIKEFCGKPLVCWNIEALVRCPNIDEIIIATDSEKIANVVESYKYPKVKIFWRSKENAQDSASTESVMLEYLDSAKLSNNTIFMLVQATSPLTQTEHFCEALNKFRDGKYDSMLSCVRSYRFFWDKDGRSKNYDYKNRPRRQDFEGELMENGAFYINSVGNILKDKNRLSGNIGIYIMPEYTSHEIDEPDDWIILENLMKRINRCNLSDLPVKLFLSDIDGTLTDGGMYYSESGDELKKFNTRDGMGFQLLREHGIKTGIITSEEKTLNERRAKKLNIDFLCQGKKYGGKLDAAKLICKELGIKLSDVAYIGDDVNCYDLLSEVGYAACPQDASEKIKSIPSINVMSKCGGCGCVREFAEKVLGMNL